MATPVSGVCAFVLRDSSPPTITFDRAADPELAQYVGELELSSFCVTENQPVATVLSYRDSELLVIAVSHSAHTVIVAWNTPMFVDLLTIIQGRRYDTCDALRNAITAAIPVHNPKAPTRLIHPYANYPYAPLARAFGYDGVRMLLSLAASESTIIFISETLSAPSLCCFGLRAALQPLEWQGMFAPVCDPFDIVATLASEVAIVGTHSSAVPSLLLSNRKNTFIANCSTGVIAPTMSSAMVLTFPPSEKLKTALTEGGDMAEGVFNYWATHCIGQFRKGLNGRAFDPFKCLFPTTAGSSRERLARNVSSSSSFGKWLTAMVQNEGKAPFTDFCARQYPDLYPEYHKMKGSGVGGVLGLGLFAKAKQTIRSMTTDVDLQLTQYMTNNEAFGSSTAVHTDTVGHIHHHHHHHSTPSAGEARMPLDCLINFEAYHQLLTPRPLVVKTGAASPTRKTGMSIKKDGPPKDYTTDPPKSDLIVVGAPLVTSASTEDLAVDKGQLVPPLSDTNNTSNLQLCADTSDQCTPPPQPSMPETPPPKAPSPEETSRPVPKYDAFAELEKLQVKPTTPLPPPTLPAEEPKKNWELEDFFRK